MTPQYMMAHYFMDFYKEDHVSQYPKGTRRVWVNWIPRGSRVGAAGMTFFGLQYYMKRYLCDLWNETFFDKPWSKIEAFHKTFIKSTLGKDPRVDHLRALHELGYLPINIYALPEGVEVPLRVPCFVVTNTIDHAFWLPNFLETQESTCLWKSCTSASTARIFREIFVRYAKMSGEEDITFVDYQGHDFSLRGMSGLEDAIMSGMGHLLSFSGTDTAPAILAANEYYGAPFSCGGSVNATEHSVMCAGSQEGELETIRRLVEDVYPTGVLSVVSDTWDLWKVLTMYLPALKDKILARDGKYVTRPDSGDPVNILCGEPYVEIAGEEIEILPKHKGVLRLMAEVFGTDSNRKGLPLINKGGAIYGDAINTARAERILDRCVNELKLSPYNQVLGIGSYTYEYVTRDTYGQAMKATAVQGSDGVIRSIFKKPVTDNGIKNSLHGITPVYRTEESTEEKPSYFVVEDGTEEQLDNCAFLKVFSNSNLLVDHDFADVRKRARA